MDGKALRLEKKKTCTNGTREGVRFGYLGFFHFPKVSVHSLLFVFYLLFLVQAGGGRCT